MRGDREFRQDNRFSGLVPNLHGDIHRRLPVMRAQSRQKKTQIEQGAAQERKGFVAAIRNALNGQLGISNYRLGRRSLATGEPLINI